MRRLVTVATIVAAVLAMLTPAHAAKREPAVILNAHFAELGGNWSVTPGHGCVRFVDGYVELCLRRNTAGDLVMGRIDTADKWWFTYGRAAARMRFIGPKGAHGAAWLQTTEDYIPGQAEIDFAENFGNPSAVHHTVHWRELGQKIGEFTSDRAITQPVTAGEWHEYEVNWRPDKYVFRVDGRITAELTGGLSDRPKMAVLSLLVSDWELPNLQADLSQYKVQVDWLIIEENPWTIRKSG